MVSQRGRGITYSATVHVIFLLFAYFGLPEFLNSRPPEEPEAITVEILPITGITNVKPSEQMPTEEKKPEEKSNPKPQPLVKTSETPPPPPEAEKPVPKPKEKKEEKKEEKKDEKKDKDKKKAKEEDLQAVLKAVKETAQKEDKNKKNDQKDDKSNSKSRSNSYDPTLPLSLSEKDAIKSQIAKCWSVPAGAKDAHELVVTLELELAEDGSVIKVELANSDKARYSRDTFFRAAADSAMRAVQMCSPIKNLPPDKFSTWRDMEMTFDPKEMLF